MKNVDRKTVVEGAPIVEAEDSPVFVFLRKDRALTVPKGVSANVATPFGIGGLDAEDTGDDKVNDKDDPESPDDPTDKPELSDIEEITYEQYFDSYNSIRYNAILKVRNSSKKKDQVVAVDARNTPKSAAEDPAAPVGGSFVTPSPSTPSVLFDRNGTAIAWGWNNSTGLGSYTSVTYEWQIRATSATSGSTISSGSKTYTASGSFAIGDSGKNRVYRVSSGQGDTPATSSARYLRVRTVVVGTNGKKYYSRYSNPI
jgi:hypothetical protein